MSKPSDTICFLIEELKSSFEYAELTMLVSGYAKVYVFVTGSVDKSKIPANVQLIELDFKDYSYLESLKSISYAPLVIWEYFTNINKGNKERTLLSIYSELSRTRFLAKKLEVHLNELGIRSGILYSFWFGMLANASTFLDGTFYKVIRAHGSDLFENRMPHNGNIPFRGYFIRKSTLVLSVSKAGTSYLRERYSRFSKKIHYSPLGTRDWGTNPSNNSDSLTLVSCAHIRNIKRIHKIAETLFYCNSNINWVHFGTVQEGDPTLKTLEANLKRLKEKKPNITVDLRGGISNEDLMKFYGNNHVSLFISLSETEGVPVSIMEAISFGIPVIATDVGGCQEIICEQTGILVAKDFDCVEVADIIDKYAIIFDKSDERRQSIKNFWLHNYEQQNNFFNFKTLLSGLYRH